MAGEESRGISGSYVIDANVTVPAGAYTTFSTVYNGKRYYLGIDTTAAKSGSDAVYAYDKPCYAAMWVVGGLYSPTGVVLDNKNYQRTIKSLWIEERCTDRAEGANKRYLALGSDNVTYTPVILTDTAHATLWYTEKDTKATGQYILGYLYYMTDATGVEVYRYVTYDPMYGFSRAYQSRPVSSQRISVWDRKTGSDLIFNVVPSTYTFGYEANKQVTKLPITSQVIFYENVDRFRSRMDQVDIFATRSTPVTDQAALADPDGAYRLSGHYEWRSNPIDEAHPEAYNGYSLMPYYTIVDYGSALSPEPTWGWRDSAVMEVSQTNFRLIDNVWHDTIYAIGTSPIDDTEHRFLRKPADGSAPTEGTYVNQNDWLYVHFTCKGQSYRDSAYVTREAYHKNNYTNLNMWSTPNDHVFPYTYNNKIRDGVTPVQDQDTAITFTISARYASGYKVVATSGNVVSSYVGEEQTLNLNTRRTYNDGGVLYDTLLVQALEADGVTPCEWIESVRLIERNQIRLKVKQYTPEAARNRSAQIRFTYRYRNVIDGSNRTETVRAIWISQEWSGAHDGDSEVYSFAHKDTEADGLQAVHEKNTTLYAIPGEEVSLPLHQDQWGYYRWYIYDGAMTRDRDLEYIYTWEYVNKPKNSNDDDFMPINHTSTASSRGRWDVIKDVNNPDNPVFAQDHFTQWTQTPRPAIQYPENEAASLTKTGKIACDVSEYYDIQSTGAVGVDLTSVTEPTLSYRHVFDVQPAIIRADEMATVRGDGNGSNWMEEHNVVVPAGDAFTLQPQHPIAHVGADNIDESELQYIYYANPNAESDDTKAGTRDGITDIDLLSNRSYARVGVKKRVNEHKRITLLTYSDLLSLGNNGTITDVLLVNPGKESGRIIGNDGENDTTSFMDYPPYRADKTSLEGKLTEQINSGDFPNYYLTIQRSGTSNKFIFQKGNNKLHDIIAFISSQGLYKERVEWARNIGTFSAGSNLFELRSYSGSTTNLPTGYSSGEIVTFYTDWSDRIILTTQSNKGYLKAASPIAIEDVTAAAEHAWLVYKVETVSERDFEETPRWEMWNGSSWVQVAHWDYDANAGVGAGVSDAAGYTMSADGSLHIGNTVHPTANTAITYRLRTEHFQLAKFTGMTRSTEDEMLRNGDIISEEDIEREYKIIFSLDMENWPAPNTSEVTAYNYHFPWGYTELSYHHPLSTVPADKRVYDTEMPGKGEYAFLNKFVVPTGPNTHNPGEEYECLAGAEHGYMLCVNAAQKSSTIMTFDYDQLSCSGQQIYLVANYCNPVNNNYDPEITADMEGTNDGIHWTPVIRYKSGKIPYRAHDNNPWFQMALPIPREAISSYRQFRCRGMINGAPNHNAHILIDRLRFIERSRAFTVFQNRATCMKDDSVTALIRLDYREDPDLYQPGGLVAFQFQKWDESANGGEGGYVAMQGSRNNGDGTYTRLPKNATEVYPGYFKDGFTAAESVETPSQKSLAGNDYGYVLIPESNYDPSASNTVGGQSALRSALIEQIITKLGLTGSAATAHRAMLDETACIRTFDQVVDQDYDDFGTYDNPHIKSFVNEGTAESPHWVLYIICRLPTTITDNNSFRIGMAMMNDLNDMPTFTDDACATYRAIQVKQVTSLKVDGEDWTNHTRAELIESGDLLPANDTYRASIALNIESEMAGKTTANPRCKFDLLHTSADVRAIGDAASEAAFVEKYGCTRTQFVDAMEAFRIDDERNTVRDEYDWSKVKPVDFTGTGRSLENATEIYNRLNRLISGGLLELGLEYRDIYMGDRADSYFYLLPIPASGQFDVINGNAAGTADTTLHASVCNDTLWLELHSVEPSAKLRFGYDSRIGDTYLVPVIRASKTTANSSLPVRVAEIMTEDEAYTVVLGWQATELIESNDPNWSEVLPFKYTQDKNMIGQTPRDYDYYDIGENVIFTPKADNSYTLRAGYWYRFRTPFYAALKADTYTADPVEATGHTLFTVAVAPDLVRWTPSHPDKANYWNDDSNWTAIVDGSVNNDIRAKVPMGDTRVIIPQVAEGLLPIVADVVVDMKDTLEFGYAKNTCKEILFKTNSQILGQEKLSYTRAFVDVQLTSGSWQTFTPALEHIYAGDMYIPENPEINDANDFLPGRFIQGDGESFILNPRIWPYAVYQGFYNTSVPVEFYNTDEDDLPVAADTTICKSSVDWVATNKIDMHYRPGVVSVLNAYGPSDEDGETLVIRLPKQENEYRGYGQSPTSGERYVPGPAITMGDGSPWAERPAFNALQHNLAYDSYTLGNNDGITYNLHNEIASEIFFFGNPTMSLIDVYRLCLDNADVLQHTDGTYRFTAYQLLDGDNYTVRTITGEGQYFIAPQRAVGLIANAPRNNLSITLTPRAMVALTGDGTIVNQPMGAGAPERRPRTAAGDDDSRYLYIAAATATIDQWGGESVSRSYITLGESATAHAGFVKGEDAPSIASGMSYYSAESFTTPLSLYTIAGNEALMLDMRDTLNGVPLVFTTLDEQYTFGETTLLSFALTGDWQQPLYLCDALTGDSALIVSGKQIAVRTPLSNQIRYYINGKPARAPQQTDITTSVDVNRDNSSATTDNLTADDHRTRVYDMLGRCIYTSLHDEFIDLSGLPSGVYLIRRGNTTERRVVR